MKRGGTSHNRTVYASGAVAPSGFRYARSATPPTLRSTHILPALVLLRKPLFGLAKRHIQPERYAKSATRTLHNVARAPPELRCVRCADFA